MEVYVIKDMSNSYLTSDGMLIDAIAKAPTWPGRLGARYRHKVPTHNALPHRPHRVCPRH
ncbi:hypothetical protein [Vulcanisaeta distributa]|uniref:hypothetical protein n=1 Tax=Vulcanisaeta distributa TaxID=164451 RepID=UPI00149408EC|nr:hypothetical protein [Vulcanisaeta distributa]